MWKVNFSRRYKIYPSLSLGETCLSRLEIAISFQKIIAAGLFKYPKRGIFNTENSTHFYAEATNSLEKFGSRELKTSFLSVSLKIAILHIYLFMYVPQPQSQSPKFPHVSCD